MPQARLEKSEEPWYNEEMRKHGRPPRLKDQEYRGAKAVAFTICVEGRQRVFTSPDVFEAQVGFLRPVAEEFHCLIPISCFMPDHAHILIQGYEEDSDPMAAMRKYKLLSGIWLDRYKHPKWQSSFYDHILRYDSWRDHAKYIAMNPVRAGLVESYMDYPFLGSLHGSVYDLFAP